jgi:hypothetical protein
MRNQLSWLAENCVPFDDVRPATVRKTVFLSLVDPQFQPCLDVTQTQKTNALKVIDVNGPVRYVIKLGLKEIIKNENNIYSFILSYTTHMHMGIQQLKSIKIYTLDNRLYAILL